jgi:hypothetical protein
MIEPVPRFQNVQFRTHEIVPATRPDGKAGASYERRTVWLSGQLSAQPRVLRTGPEFSADADYRGLCRLILHCHGRSPPIENRRVFLFSRTGWPRDHYDRAALLAAMNDMPLLGGLHWPQSK